MSIQKTTRRYKARRGVLLLIVLSLLVLFMLVGLSFLVSASQFKRVAQSAAKSNQQGMPGRKLADAVMYQLVRGTSNPSSAIRSHSLLEDMYGRDYLIGRASSNRAADFQQSSHQIHEIAFDTNDSRFLLSSANEAQLRDDYYGGCVLTFLNGPAAGQSTRIIEYKPQTMGRILVKGVPVRMPSGSIRPPYVPNDDSGESQFLRFIINGRPFSGTGAGYNPVTGMMDNGVGTGLNLPAAFMPNASFRDFFALRTAYDVGGMDESWDAVDYQNMALAKTTALGVQERLHEIDTAAYASNGASPPQVAFASYLQNTSGVTPSFHRPYLIAHLATHDPLASTSDPVLTAQRAASMRVNPADHPSFSGSNPAFDPINGPWDVDNSGSGIADSVWIDAGLAPVAGPDGRLYKPLAAVHVVDMDGRISLNAADSQGRLRAEEIGYIHPRVPAVTTSVRFWHESQDRNAWGLGFGPTDIRVHSSDLSKVVQERYAGVRRLDNGNLAEQIVPQTSNKTPLWEERIAPGSGPLSVPDELFTIEGHAYRLEPTPRVPVDFLFENSVGSPGNPGTGYGSPTDLFARSFPYLDPLGNIVWIAQDIGQFDGLRDPYKINLLSDNPDDSPFEVRDLEAILRFDSPEQDQTRLAKTLNSGSLPNQFTTHSFSVPSLPGISPGRFRTVEGRINRVDRGGNGLTNSLRDMFAAKIVRMSPSISTKVAHRIAGKLMAPDFMRGEKLDLNKVLIPNEGLNALQYRDDPVGAEARQTALSLRKEIFARHLFNLLMLLSDDQFNMPAVIGQAPPLVDASRELHVRRLAQWAVNVVDFGDADSVMTQFRYDVNPFNELDPFDPTTGLVRIPTTPEEEQAIKRELRVVWGMEHPELLLTETLAFHDRLAKDTKDDPTGKDLETGDPYLDSIDEPEGSAYFELFCPRSPQPIRHVVLIDEVTARGPEDLWSSPGNGQQQLLLGKMIGPNPATPNLIAKPVWRLAISEVQDEENHSADFALQNSSDSSSFEPTAAGTLRNPLETDDPVSKLKLRRFVWFNNLGNDRLPKTGEETGDEETADNTFLSQSAASLIDPGGYVLVGPNDNGRMVTHVGRKRDGTPSLQQLTGIRADRFISVPVSTNPAELTRRTGEQLNVTEPLGGYDRSLLPSDIPLDNVEPTSRDDLEQKPLFEDPEDTAQLLTIGVKPNFRTVFLQRLANPNLPWHPTKNPYRTLDWMPIDVHVFNSLHGREGDVTEDANDDVERWNFASREKVGVRNQSSYPLRAGETVTEPGLLNVWKAWSKPTTRSRNGGFGEASFTLFGFGFGFGFDRFNPSTPDDYTKSAHTDVAHTLGGLNRFFRDDGLNVGTLSEVGYVGAPAAIPDPSYASHCFQYPNVENTVTRRTLIQSAQESRLATFPSLVWHNRPYANPYELLLVPATSNARLSVEYSVSQSTSPYQNPDERAEHRGAFGHLLNFFHSSTGRPDESISQAAGNYFRILDFVHVPSRFKGTRKYLNQNALGVTNPFRKDPTNYIDLVTTERPELLANGELGWRKSSMSEFREPGKVNINTASWRVWEQLGFDSTLRTGNNDRRAAFELTMAGYNYPRIELSRTDASDGVSDLSGRYPNGLHPAEYPNPLRDGTTGDLMSRLPGTGTQLAIDATMLRSGAPRLTGGLQPALGTYALQASEERNRFQLQAFAIQNRKTNAYFRFKDLMKLGNSVTSQSNVYAIWVTIGYFEIEPNIGPNGERYHIDTRHPDGYRYGIELGSDLGQVTRNRSFYIVDRSIPVAFEPGVNHNIDKAILVRRQLE